MKKLSGLIIFLFCAFISYGQIPNKSTVSNPSTQYHIPNMFADLASKLPIVDTINNKATPYVGALTILPTDTIDKSVVPPIYMSNGSFWGRIAGGGGGVGVDSVTFPNGSICVWSGGFSQCYPLSGYYDSTGYNGDSTYYFHFNNGNFIDSVWIPFTHVYAGQAVGFKDTTYLGVRAQIFNSETHYVTPDSLYYVTVNPDGTIKDSTYFQAGGSSGGGGDGSGISQLGESYDLIRVNDSTYRSDSSLITSRARLTNELSLVVHKALDETITGKKSFTDSLLLIQKPIVQESSDNADVSLYLARVTGVAFPWLQITGGSLGSKIIMGANNSGSAADELRLVANYADTLWTGLYRPLYIDAYDHLTLRGNRGGGGQQSDSAIRFVTGSDINNIAGVFNNAGNFSVLYPMSIGKLTPAVASAALEIQSTTQGVLLPRMTTTQKNAISSPAEGLEVYDLTLHQKSYWNGTTWINY